MESKLVTIINTKITEFNQLSDITIEWGNDFLNNA